MTRELPESGASLGRASAWGVSFSRGVREELARQKLKPCCQRALLSALLGEVKYYLAYKSWAIRFSAASTIRMAIVLLKEVGLAFSWKKYTRSGGNLYVISLGEEALELRKSPSEVLAWPRCCRCAYMSGLFLLRGAVSPPSCGYHLEWVFSQKEIAETLVNLLQCEEFKAYLIQRRSSWVVSLKRAEEIASALTLLGANSSRLCFEERRAFKEISNDLHRRVNAESANLERSMQAAVRQIASMEYLRSNGYLLGLSEELVELAILRIDNPEASLRELGAKSSPPIPRSTVARRLAKLEKIAQLRGAKSENFD